MANLTTEQQRIRSMIEAIALVSARRLGIQDTQGFLNAMLAVAWGENSWTAPSQGDIDIDGKPSYGPYQIRPGHKGVQKTPQELLDPAINITFAADYLGDVYKKYEDQGETDWRQQVWHMYEEGQVAAVNLPQVQTNIQNAIGFIEAESQMLPYTPTSTSPEGEIPAPKREDFIDSVTGRLDYEGYYLALDAYQKLQAGIPSVGPDEIDYINSSINLLAAQMSGEQIDAQKADMELSKRLGALTEAGKTYRELAPYSLPEGAKWIPGGEPGGLYEKIGLGTMPAQTIRINPLASALAVMGETPDTGPMPDTSLEAILAGAQRLREGMGATSAAPVASLEAALAIPGPAMGEPATTVPVTPAGPQPVAPPSFPPSAGLPPEGQAIGPEGYQPYEPEVLSPEEANRIAQIIMMILGSMGLGGGSRPLATPTPTPPGIFEQALRG